METYLSRTAKFEDYLTSTRLLYHQWRILEFLDEKKPLLDVAALFYVSVSKIRPYVDELSQLGLVEKSIEFETAPVVTMVNPNAQQPIIEEEPFAQPLRPIVDFILREKGHGMNGSLAVYQVFMNLPDWLFNKDELKGLNLLKDDLDILDPDLYEAIICEIPKVIGISYKE